MLDMFNPSDSAVTVVPYNQGDEKMLGRVVTSDYFGDIPADRLLDDNSGTLYFKTDGKRRGKLGMNAKRTKAIAGNYDPVSKRLTVVTFDVDPSAVYPVSYTHLCGTAREMICGLSMVKRPPL